MTTISWNARVLSGDWATAANWLGLQVPGQFDTVSLASTSAATITVGRADTITVGAITVGSGINDAISITGGALTVNGTSNFGATLTIVSGTLTLANAITLSGGTVTNAGTIAKTSGTGTATIAAGVTNSGTISVSAGTLAINGALTETGQLSASTGAAINLTGGGTLGGTLVTTGTGAIALSGGTFTQGVAALTTAATLALAAGYQFTTGQTLTLTGSAAFDAGITGPGTLITSGTVALAGGQFSGGASWTINGQASEAGSANLLLSSPAAGQTATITIGASGALTLADASRITSLANDNTIANAGTLTKTTGTGFALIIANVTNTGTISATAGTLELALATTNSGTISATTGTVAIAGALTGSGQVSAGTGGTIDLIGGGTLGGALVTTGTGLIELTGGTFTQSVAALTTAANFSLGASYQFTAGQTLTLTGKATLVSNLYGPGTLITSGAVTLNGGELSQGTTWTINSQVSEAGSVDLLLSSPLAGQSATITIGSTGGLTLVDASQITSLANDNTITNAGTIAKTTGTGTASITANLVNSGTISATAGTLNIGGSVANTGNLSATGATLGIGTISGSGAITAGAGGTINFFGGGVLGNFISAAASGLVALTGGTFSFAPTAFDWSFHTMLGGAQIDLGSAQTFTLDAVSAINGTVVQGSGGGTLITTDTTTESAMVVDQGATWQVKGTVNQQTAGLALADNATSPAQTGTLAIAGSGTFNLTDNSGIGVAGTETAAAGFGQITNAGTLAKTGGTGISTVLASLSNSGTIAAQSGTLDIAGAITTTGALTVASGAALQLTGGGVLGGTLTNASITQVLLGGAAFTLAQSGTTWNGVDLASALDFTPGQTFTLGGSDTITGEVAGAGTLTLSGNTAFAAGAMIADGATATVSGNATLTGGTLLLDAGSTDPVHGTAAATGTLAITSGGSLDFTDDLGAIGFGTIAGSVVNAGTLAKTAGTGTNTISDNVTNTGTLAAQTGLLLVTGALANSGTLSAVGGSIAVYGATQETGTITVGNGQSVSLGANSTLGGTATTSGTGVINLDQGITFSLNQTAVTWAGAVADQAIVNVAAGQSFTLSGHDTLNGSFRQGGTVVVAGSSTITANGSIGLGLTMDVTGSLNINGGQFNLDAGDGVTQGAGTLAIAAGGTLLLTGGFTGAVKIGYAIDQGTITNAGTINAGSDGSAVTIDAALTNSGTITATGGGVLLLDQAVVNTGTITADGGNILFYGGLSGGGAVNVDGTSHVLVFGGGKFTNLTFNVASTAQLTLLGTWTFDGPAFTLGANLTFQGDVQFASGQVLTVNGPNPAFQGTYSGAGTLVTTDTVTSAGVILQSGATWDVKGTVNQDNSGGLTLNTNSGAAADAGTLRIDAGGTYNLIGYTNIVGGVNFGTVNNAGTLAKTGSTGTSMIQAYVNNTGTISVTGGSLQIEAPMTNTGTLSTDAGAELFFEGSIAVDSQIGGTITNNGTLAWYNGGITGTFTGNVTNNGNVLAGYGTLDLAGAIAGTGTLTIDAGATIELGTVPAAGQTITFAAGGGTTNISNQYGAHLVLDRFGAATIAGLANHDTIDLAGVTLASATISGNTLVLTTTGGATATLTSTTSLAGLGTSIASDGHAGTLVSVQGIAAPVPSVIITNFDLGLLNPGDSNSVTLDVQNKADPATGTALNASFTGVVGPVTASGSITGLGPGQVDATSLQITVAPTATTATGTLNASATVGFVATGAAAPTPASQTITFTGVVVNAPVAEFALPSGYTIKGNATTGYTVNLGAVQMGASPLTVAVGEANGATGTSADLLGSISWSGVYGFGLSTAGPASALGPGQSVLNQAITCYPTSPGTYTAKFTLNPGEVYDGYGRSMPPITLTVTFAVVSGQTTYTLTPTPEIIGADTLSNNLFIAAANTLNSGLQIFGGPGANQFQLTGGGKFNLNLPAQLNSIGKIEATEGQSAFNGLPETYQTVTLRNGANETVVVNSANAAAGNTKPVGITIYAGSGNAKITLGTGHDQVYLGSGTATIWLGKAGNQIFGGSGSATIYSNLGRAAALVQGTATGSLTMLMTKAGTATLNNADTWLTVKPLAGSTLYLAQGTNLTADGSAGNDTIIAQAATQTLIGGNGDVLTSAGGDTFAFGAKFGTDTINGFVASGSAHDTIAISKSAFADWAHLLGATVQQGSDLLITLDASDTILLRNVSLANFVSSDARFV